MRQALIDISGKLDCLLIEVLQNRKQIEELDKSKIGVKKYTICCVFGFCLHIGFRRAIFVLHFIYQKNFFKHTFSCQALMSYYQLHTIAFTLALRYSFLHRLSKHVGECGDAEHKDSITTT